jgi:hypothetical protein
VSLRDSRRSPSSRGISAIVRLKIVGLLILLSAIVVAGGWLYFRGQSNVQTDQVTLCPVNRPISEVTVILLDVSEKFSEPQRLQIENELTRIRDSVPEFGAVEVYALDRIGRRVTEPVLHLCNPGTGAKLNRIYQNPDLARRKWAAFTSRLGAELDRQMQLPNQSSSPIFEAIQATALRTFGRPVYDGLPKQLVLVSDLLQNLPGEFTMYANVQDFDAFKATPYFSQVRADLQGVSVDLLYLARSTVAVQGARHIQFWDQYFRAQGATVESVKRIFGDH